jgi:DNA uptake protein ComE-like DNA-binding protein
MKAIFISLILFIANSCYAQVPPTVQQQLEAHAEAEETSTQLEGHYLQQLEYFRKHPININATSSEELQQLKILNATQVMALLQYEKFAGKLIDIYELQAVPGLDLKTIGELLPYIRVGEALTIRESLGARLKGDQSVLIRMSRVMQKSKGYLRSSANHYLGNPDHLLFQYRFQYKDLLYFGLSADKDAGEQFFRGAQHNGFDFYSIHLFVRKLRLVKALAIGDFTVSMGQGLIQWQSFATGKSSATMDIKRSSPVLMPYRSSGENNFYRGVGISVGRKSFDATGFISYRKISGHIIDSLETFSSMNTSGYFRTPSEIIQRNNISLFSFGGNLRWEKNNSRLSLNMTSHKFGGAFDKPDQPYNYFSFSGRQLINVSVDYCYTFRNIHFFGECARDGRGAFALINGMLMSVDRDLDLSFLYRNIQKDYTSFAAQAFTESSTPGNENGLYAGLSFRPFPLIELNAYADFFHFAWLRFRTNAPVDGSEYLVQFAYRPTKQIELYVRYQNKNKPINGAGSGSIEAPALWKRQDLRLNFSNQLSRTVSLKGRVEVLWYNSGTLQQEEGFLLYAEASVKTFVKIFSDLRIQYFETDGFNSRLYAYEGDVPYSSTVAEFFQKGFQYYISSTYKWKKNFSLSLRWSAVIYRDVDHVGSGLDTIDGRKKDEIKMQLTLDF